MFKASLEPMTEVLYDIQDISLQLKSCADEILRVRAALHEFSYLEHPLRRLTGEEDKLHRDSAQATQLRRVLGAVQEQYQRSDREVMDYCEEAVITWKREETAYYRLDWVSRLFV